MARRATFAGLACALWMLGFDVAPMAHMLFHDALDEHHHHGHHHAPTQDHQADGRGDAPDGAPTPAEHGEGSVAHRDLAAEVPLPAVPRVLEALLTSAPPEVAAHEERPGDRTPQTTRARAPPTKRA